MEKRNTRVLVVPGTWDFAPGMLGGVTKHLDRSRLDITFIKYPQTFALPTSYATSKRIAIRQLKREWERDLKADIILLGYSQGADAAGDFAQIVEHHPRLKAVALVADPKRPHGKQIGTQQLTGHGIAGQRHIHHPNVWQAAYAGDVICDATPGSLWRAIADTTQYAGLNLPAWVIQLFKTCLRPGGLQLAPPMSMGSRVWGAIATVPELYRYLNGWHTSYGAAECPGTGNTYLKEIAQRINNL